MKSTNCVNSTIIVPLGLRRRLNAPCGPTSRCSADTADWGLPFRRVTPLAWRTSCRGASTPRRSSCTSRSSPPSQTCTSTGRRYPRVTPPERCLSDGIPRQEVAPRRVRHLLRRGWHQELAAPLRSGDACGSCMVHCLLTGSRPPWSASDALRHWER